MKKIYFLMLMLLMSVSGMWAQDWGNIGSLKVSPAMQDGEFVSGTVFYQIQNKKQGYLSTSSMSGDNLLFVNSGMSADGFRWAILGDAENGFQFVNKVTKTAIGMNKFEVTNQENQSLATTSYLTADLEDANTRFALAPHKYVTPYFIVTAQDNHYFYWNQLTTLGYWYSGEGYEYGYRGWKQNEAGTANSNKGDDGASFRFNEVETLTVVAEADYTVVIVGAPEGYTVSYNGAEYANGDVITGIIWNINLLTVNPIEGYKSEVSVENNTVTITFTRKPITSLEEVEAGRLYTLTSVNRGSFVYASAHEGYLSGSGLTKNEFDATSENFQFAFVEDEGNTYLWSRGAGKFVEYANPNVTLTDAVPAAGLSLLASTGTEKAEFPTVLAIDGSHQINMSTDQQQGLLTTWNSTSDKGNMLAIVDIDATLTAEELAAIDAILHPTSFTYTVTSNKSEGGVIYDETPYTAGSEIADLSETIEVEDLEAIEIEGLEAHISMEGYTISVYYLPTAADLTGLAVKSVGEKTQTIEAGKWYTLTQVRGAGETPAYNNEGAIYRAAAAQTVPVVFAEGTEATEVAEYLIRFVPGDFEGSYYMQFGDGSFWGAKESGNAELKAYTDFAENYLVYGVDGTEGIGINQTNNGTTFGRILDNNGADATVAYWDNGKVTTTGNNLWFIYPVELEAPAPEVEFTVAYDGDETITVTPKDPEATYFWGIANDAVMGIQSYSDVYEFFEGYLLPYFWEQDMCTGEITMTDTEYRGIWSYGMTEGLNYILVANGYWDPEANEGEGVAVRTGDIEVYEITTGEPTGVGTVLRSEASSRLTFNLQGQRVNKVQRGLNIVGGKKVLK